jgi:hypothetical protein
MYQYKYEVFNAVRYAISTMIRMRIHHQELSQQSWSPADHLSGQELTGGLQHPVWNKYKISTEKMLSDQDSTMPSNFFL